MARIFFFCDICNLCAAFLSCFMLFLRFMGIWQWTMLFPEFIVVVIANLYGCFLVQRSKSYIVDFVLQMFDSQPGLPSISKRELLEKRLNSRLLLSDLAEFSFGMPASVIIDVCVVFLQLGFLTFTAPIVATSISVYFENVSAIYPNATEFDPATLLIVVPRSSAFLIAMSILLCFFLTTALFQSARQSSILSALAIMSFIGVIVIMLQTIAAAGSHVVPASNETLEDLGRQTILYLDNHRLSTIQVIATLFTVEASMKRTRRVFLPTVLLCGLLTLVLGCFFVYAVGKDGYGVLAAVDKRSSVHLLMILCAVCVFPLQNFPLYHVIERRILNRGICCTEELEEDELNLTAPTRLFLPGKESFMTKMRQQNFEALNTDEIAEDVIVKVTWLSRYAMRFFAVLFEMSLAGLLYSVRPLLRSFIFLCLLASRFLAIIFPVAMFLKLRWTSGNISAKVLNVIVIVLCIAEVCWGTYYILKDI